MSTKKYLTIIVVILATLSFKKNDPLNYKNTINESPRTTQEWGVIGIDATYYYLDEDVTNLTLGVHYGCNEARDSICTITLRAEELELYAPGKWRVRKTESTIKIFDAKKVNI
jgi:hypothetical protein